MAFMIRLLPLSHFLQASDWQLSLLHTSPYHRVFRITQGQTRALLGPRLQGVLRGLYGRQSAADQTLVQLRQSLSTLQSQVARQHAKPAPALRPLNPVHEKDFT